MKCTHNVRIPRPTHERLARLADSEGRTHGAVIDRALLLYEEHTRDREAVWQRLRQQLGGHADADAAA